MDSLKFVIEEGMTSQKRDDVLAFFGHYVIFRAKRAPPPQVGTSPYAYAPPSCAQLIIRVPYLFD